MRGALIDATLPVVMRRTCVCPSRLFSAAMKFLAMQVGGEVTGSKARSVYFYFLLSWITSRPSNSDADDTTRTEMLGDHPRAHSASHQNGTDDPLGYRVPVTAPRDVG
jgi:hypothetical protein